MLVVLIDWHQEILKIDCKNLCILDGFMHIRWIFEFQCAILNHQSGCYSKCRPVMRPLPAPVAPQPPRAPQPPMMGYKPACRMGCNMREGDQIKLQLFITYQQMRYFQIILLHIILIFSVQGDHSGWADIKTKVAF